MVNAKLERMKTGALHVGKNVNSLEPTRRAAAYGWTRGDNTVSPSAYAKHHHLLAIFEQRGHQVFIEAGTYKGETVASCVPHAAAITSVELHPELYAAAVRRFADEPLVTPVHGNSLNEVPRVVAAAPSAPLVFLDGHFSVAGTAKGEELKPAESTLGRLAAVAPPGATIVADDLRYFGSGLMGFPQLDTIASAARRAFPHANIRTGLDSMVVEID